MDRLTKEELLPYLQDILHIPWSELPNLSDQSLSANTKLSYLETIFKAYLEHEPFQSITLMSHDVKSRHRPSWDEIKSNILCGRGGLCYWLNSFIHHLLSALGCNTSMTFCTFNLNEDNPNTHLLVLLHDLVAPGSLHLVDVGVGFYFPRAMSLDFETESQEYTDSFLTYKFYKESKSTIWLLQKVEEETPASISTDKPVNQAEHARKDVSNNCVKLNKNSQEIPCETTDKTNRIQEVSYKAVLDTAQNIENEKSHNSTWKRLYFFNPLLTHKNLEPFFSCFDSVFSDITRLSTHSSPRAMCWPNGRFLGIVNYKLVTETNEGKLVKSSITDLEVRDFQASINQSPSDTEGQNASNGDLNSLQDRHKTSHGDNIIINGKKQDVEEAEQVTKEQTLQQQLLEMEPLVEAYQKYFPQLPSNMVRAALRNWLITGNMFPAPELIS